VQRDVRDHAVGVEEQPEDVADYVVPGEKPEVILAQVAQMDDRGVQRGPADADHGLVHLAGVPQHLLDGRLFAQRGC
jgi:hypothetical protein